MESPIPTKVIVLGGGAAGYFAAINAAEKHSHASVLLLEGSVRSLVKVGVSGGGRCNLTHHCFDPGELVKKYPRGSKELRGPFSRFQPIDTVAWFESRGVPVKSEADGRMFPVSNNSKTVIDCLETEAEKHGVSIKLNEKIKKIEKTDQGFLLTAENKEYRCDHLLLATGGSLQGMELAKSLGHSIQPCLPSLFTFEVKDSRLDELMGLSFKNVNLELVIEGKKILKEQGPLLITHWGLSGPAVLKMSAWAAPALFKSHYKATLKINFLPELECDLWVFLKNFKLKSANQSLKRCPFEALPKRYWQRLLKTAGIDEKSSWAQLSREKMLRLSEELSSASFEICGKGEFKEEFVTCGGVTLKEVNFKTMESKICPGLFFAGEILDIDGVTGGFNFQNAWTTAWIASEGLLKAE